MYKTDKYYSKDVHGNIIVWEVHVYDHLTYGVINIYSGRLYNERLIIKIIDTGKNIGKSNQTSPYEQAVKEVKAKEKLKSKNGYKTLKDLNINNYSIDSLSSILDKKLSINKTDSNNILKPMKAVKFHGFKYPAILQLKINEYRCVYDLVKGTVGEGMFEKKVEEPKLLSKEGHEFPIPHIKNSIASHVFKSYSIRFDGELYAHGFKLSEIKRMIPIKMSNGTVTHNTLNNNSLKYYVFDLSIPDVSQTDRLKLKDVVLNDKIAAQLNLTTKDVYLNGNLDSFIVNMKDVIVWSDEEVFEYLNVAIVNGFEGVIVRDMDSEYVFGGRRQNMAKLKKVLSGEFKVLDIIKKNEDSTRTYISFVLQNDINDKTFECTPEGNEKYRKYALEHKEEIIGQYVTATYYERTINDIPFQAVGRIRDSWDLDVNDLIPDN